jgi:hypothetical protein
MDIRNPRYQELANELNKINTTSAQLREDNKKLLGIRNLMKDENRVEELSKGMSSSQQAMYNDILTGNTQNFVNINGKLHWQNPDNADAEPVAISSIDAAGPTYSNSVVMEKHIGLYNEVINAQFVDDAVLHSKINSLWKSDGVGNAGLKSFIFDNQGADDAMGFDTSDWFTQWYKDNNIVGEENQLAEYERIRNSGVLADGATGNVKQHFSAWYHSKMKGNIASQYNKKKAAETSTNNEGILNKNENEFELFVPDNFKYKSKLPPLNSNNTYEGQTGTGTNFGQTNSPFAGITQYGWLEAGLDSDDAILEFGDGAKVVKALTDSYAKYGFKFEESGTFQDKLKVYHNNILKGEVEFDNVTGDEANAKKLQQIMHLAVGLPSTQTITTEEE